MTTDSTTSPAFGAVSADAASFEPTADTTVRNAARGSYDRAEAYRILDDAFVAHVGFVLGGRPFVIPMVYGRDGDSLLLHGSVATRLMRSLDAGAEACVTVTHVDGLVLARSHFHHSVNYRSVVVLGTATRLRDADADRAFEVIVDHAAPGRAAETRATNDVERRQTMVLRVPITEASVKVRTGGPVDDPIDLEPCGQPGQAAPPGAEALPASSAVRGSSAMWAGVLPLSVVAGEPIADEFTASGVAVPTSISPWRRPGPRPQF